MELTVFSSTNWNFVFGGVFVALVAAILLYARSIPQGGRSWWVLVLVTAGLTLAGTLVGGGAAGTLLIDAAAFAAVGLVFLDKSPAARKAGRLYLVMVAAAVICLLLAERLAGDGSIQPAYPIDRMVVFLLLAGFVLKLALLPAYFWLPAVAESAAPMSVALIVAVVDIAAFKELVNLRVSMAWVFSAHPGIWLAVALLSIFGGALLALGQKNIRRMLAFSTIDDMGYLLLGVIAGPEIGLTGALLGALAHAIFKVILFGSVGAAECRLGHPLTLDDHGLAKRFPRSGAAFIIGALGMIGVPPLIGFAGRWRLYLSGVAMGGVWLGLALAGATVLALFYYVRAIHRVWMGPADGMQATEPEPRLAGWVLAVLAIGAVVLGLFPAWLLSL
jgi:multicomponent Na+:H+ antiporter subunit D